MSICVVSYIRISDTLKRHLKRRLVKLLLSRWISWVEYIIHKSTAIGAWNMQFNKKDHTKIIAFLLHQLIFGKMEKCTVHIQYTQRSVDCNLFQFVHFFFILNFYLNYSEYSSLNFFRSCNLMNQIWHAWFFQYLKLIILAEVWHIIVKDQWKRKESNKLWNRIYIFM